MSKSTNKVGISHCDIYVYFRTFYPALDTYTHNNEMLCTRRFVLLVMTLPLVLQPATGTVTVMCGQLIVTVDIFLFTFCSASNIASVVGYTLYVNCILYYKRAL